MNIAWLLSNHLEYRAINSLFSDFVKANEFILLPSKFNIKVFAIICQAKTFHSSYDDRHSPRQDIKPYGTGCLQ
jgi:hypothetical protein